MKEKILILLSSVFLVISSGCSQPKAPESSAKTAGPADFHNGRFGELPVHRETQAETLARISAESEAPERRVHGPARKGWYGSTLLGLGRLRKVTVPHVPAGSDSKALEVTVPQIQKALTQYVLIDYEKSHSSTHIPKGTIVTMEYENGVVGWINMYGGIPYDVSLQKDGIVGEYGLGTGSEQNAAPEAASPPR